MANPGGLTLTDVVRARNDSAEIRGIWIGTTFVWPDPWTDTWDEGVSVIWEQAWRDAWSAPSYQVTPEGT